MLRDEREHTIDEKIDLDAPGPRYATASCRRISLRRRITPDVDAEVSGDTADIPTTPNRSPGER